ncbi:unnamed protein product [Ixodes hexagonus]
MFSAEINRCSVFGGCVLCIVYFLDLLTVSVAAFLVISVAGANYYLHKREENFRHRLRILGLIKHDKRERNSKTEHNSSQRVVAKGSATRRSSNISRTYDSPYEYTRVVPGNKFETTSQSLSRSEVEDDECNFASPMSSVKNVYFDRSCQSTFTSDHARKSQLDWAPPTARRHPIQQERYSVGSYPTVCLTKSPLPVARPFTSPEVIAPVKVKILPLAASPRLSSSFSQQRTTGGEIDKQDPCSTESVIQALKERRKRAAAAAYRDSLEAAELGMPSHSSKRSRRDSMCGMGSPMPSFMPVATSVGGLGPPFHSPSSPKRAMEGAYKRARLPSTAGTSSSKRQRNNAISMSYCSSKTVLETSQLQKRKAAAAARETPPRPKLARNEDRSSETDSTTERVEDSTGECTSSIPVDRSTPDLSKSEGRISRPRRDALPSDQSVRKKRLVFPEHVATLEEHESDHAMDQQRLSRMLGSVRDVYQTSQGKAAATSSQANVEVSAGTTAPFSLPSFSIASTTTSAVSSQESTKAVSVISSPLVSVSSAPTKKLGETPTEKTVPGESATIADTPSSPLLPPKILSTSEAPKTNPLLGAPLSIVTTSGSASALKLPASVPILATSTAANILLGGLSTPTLSSSSAPAKLELPAPITSFAPATSFTSGSNPLLVKPGSLGGFGVTTTTSVTAPSTTFGAQTFKMNGPSTTGTGTTFVCTPTTSLTLGTASSSPFQFGTSSMPTTVAASTTAPTSSMSLPSFGSTVQASSMPTLPTATTTLQRNSSGGFAFGASLASSTAPAASAFGSTAKSGGSSVQQSTGGGFAFGAGLATSTTPTSSAFGSAANSDGSSAQQSAAGGFAFGAGLATSTTSQTPSFGATTSSSAGSVFKFGAPPTQSAPSLTQQPVPAFSTTASALPAFSRSSPFAFGTTPTTTKAETVAAPFAFGKSSTSLSSRPSFGIPTTSSFALGSSLTSLQAPATTPLFPSAANTSQPSGGATTTASRGGFQFGAQQPGFSFAVTNGLTNGVSSSSIASTQSTGVFKFGGSTNSAPSAGAPSQFNFMASQCGPSLASNPALNFGAPVANNSLFSIGTAASHSERTMARPRSKRISKK